MPIPAFEENGWQPSGHHQADWAEVILHFGGSEGSPRQWLTQSLLHLRDVLREHGIAGSILLDGRYISSKSEPGDFDVLLIGPADIQARKENNPELAMLLDAEDAENHGYSLFFLPANSSALELLRTLWDFTKEGLPKGVVEVKI